MTFSNVSHPEDNNDAAQYQNWLFKSNADKSTPKQA
jgi:hypothetical protein